jgi:hypothetical protein
LSQATGTSTNYADKSVLKGIDGNSGRDALLSLEEIIRSRKSSSQSRPSHDHPIATSAR